MSHPIIRDSLVMRLLIVCMPTMADTCDLFKHGRSSHSGGRLQEPTGPLEDYALNSNLSSLDFMLKAKLDVLQETHSLSLEGSLRLDD